MTIAQVTIVHVSIQTQRHRQCTSLCFHQITSFYGFPIRENRKHATDGCTDGQQGRSQKLHVGGPGGRSLATPTGHAHPGHAHQAPIVLQSVCRLLRLLAPHFPSAFGRHVIKIGYSLLRYCIKLLLCTCKYTIVT